MLVEHTNKSSMCTDSQLTAPCLHLCTWQWRSAAVRGRGRGRARAGARDQQIRWVPSLEGGGWCGWEAARGSPRWRWWREAARSCRLGDPGIFLAEGATVGEVSGVSFMIHHFEVGANSLPSVEQTQNLNAVCTAVDGWISIFCVPLEILFQSVWVYSEWGRRGTSFCPHGAPQLSTLSSLVHYSALTGLQRLAATTFSSTLPPLPTLKRG